MNPIVLQIIIGVMTGTLVVIMGVFVKKTFDRWKAVDKKQELYYMKLDCIVHAMSSVNHGVGQEFKSAYDEKFEELIAENKYVYSEK